MLSYSPNATTGSMETMRELLADPEWRSSSWAPRMRSHLAARLDDPSRSLRYLAISALPVIYEGPALAHALKDKIDAEEDTDLLTLAVTLVNVYVRYDLADSILDAASTERSGGPSLPALLSGDDDSECHELRNAWVTMHLNCYLHAGTSHASIVVREWFGDPSSYPELFRAAAVSLRNLFSASAEEPLRSQAFELVRSAARKLALDLAREPADSSVVRVADALVEQLYFASGAYQRRGEDEQPTCSQKAAWYADGIVVLEDLTAVTHPHSCYQLLETLEYFIDDNPERTFRAIAATVKTDSLLRVEGMGVELTVRIVERYLAEHRQLFVIEPDLLAQLRRMLEVFARIGWPEALHLSYSLGDIFR